MKLAFGVLMVSLLVLAANATTCTRKDFELFKTQYNKVYNNAAEEEARFAIFCDSLQRVNKRNKQQKQEEGAVKFGITKFSDLTESEFRNTYLGYRPKKKSSRQNQQTRVNPSGTPPTTFDWRNRTGVLTPVYDQGQCGSCWAFSAVENIESQWALSNHTLVSLSPQQVVSCDTTDYGCNGGDTTTAYEYVIKAGGLESWQEYPYTATNGKCTFDKSKVVAQITNWEYAGTGDESAMVNYLVAHGPVSICVDAAKWSDYSGGILPASQCGKKLDHCVLAVGYDLNQKYWIVRNSWGTDWGVENGYIYLQYGTNTCGLADEPTSAKV